MDMKNTTKVMVAEGWVNNDDFARESAKLMANVEKLVVAAGVANDLELVLGLSNNYTTQYYVVGSEETRAAVDAIREARQGKS